MQYCNEIWIFRGALYTTRIRDNYKTGRWTDFWRELVIRHAQVRFEINTKNKAEKFKLNHPDNFKKNFTYTDLRFSLAPNET